MGYDQFSLFHHIEIICLFICDGKFNIILKPPRNCKLNDLYVLTTGVSGASMWPVRDN